jgi:predicted GNAT family acetyltransferase
MSKPPPIVERDEPAHRFKIAGEPSAYLRYANVNGHLQLIHTDVPSEFQGRGFASDLAHAALEYARAEHMRVEVVCPFVRGYLARHPEYADLVDHF